MGRDVGMGDRPLFRCGKLLEQGHRPMLSRRMTDGPDHPGRFHIIRQTKTGQGGYPDLTLVGSPYRIRTGDLRLERAVS